MAECVAFVCILEQIFLIKQYFISLLSSGLGNFLLLHYAFTLKLTITSLRRLIAIVTSFPLKIDGIGIETSAIKTRQNCSAPQL